MRYVVFVIDGESNTGTTDEMAAIDAFNDRLERDGHWVFAAGISGPGEASVIDNRAGVGISQAGSLFADVQHYSGFWVIEAPSHEVAVELATAGSQACNRRVELRPFLR